jgi:hypothetical protein
VAHQADPPNLALEVAQPAADLDAEVREQSLADRQVVHARGNQHGIELRELIPLLRGILEAQGIQSGLEGQVIPAVPCPAGLETLFVKQP